MFQLTHLLRGATNGATGASPAINVSTHAPLARCDIAAGGPGRIPRFQLTHLLRGATLTIDKCVGILQVSTHAPLARCDQGDEFERSCGNGFNSRTSCEVRQISAALLGKTYRFNSRTSCEVRLPDTWRLIPDADVSTHAPLARCDKSMDFSGQRCKFQLAHLLRGATRRAVVRRLGQLRFNSRTSCEVRPTGTRPRKNGPWFQLTHLLRGATCRPPAPGTSP